jgi:hypothetical protein
MRLDYPLYGLAIVLFAAAVLLYVYILPNEISYPIGALVVGFLFIGSGFFLRPKVASAPVASTPAADPVSGPAPQAAPAAETPAAASPPSEPVRVVENPKPAPEPIAQPTIPALEPVTALPAIAAPPFEAALPAPAATRESAKAGFRQIRGISASRAEQLKSIGVTSIAELADANPEELAAKLSVSSKIVKMWVGCAKKLK